MPIHRIPHALIRPRPRRAVLAGKSPQARSGRGETACRTRARNAAEDPTIANCGPKPKRLAGEAGSASPAVHIRLEPGERGGRFADPAPHLRRTEHGDVA